MKSLLPGETRPSADADAIANPVTTRRDSRAAAASASRSASLFLNQYEQTGQFVLSNRASRPLAVPQKRPALRRRDGGATAVPRLPQAAAKEASFSQQRESRLLANLRRSFLGAKWAKSEDSFYRELVRFAVMEAEALAWASPFPLLLFPELASEKAATAERYYARQSRVWNRSAATLANAS